MAVICGIVSQIWIAAICVTTAVACGQARYGDINISSKLEAADGLDLKAVGELVKKVKDAKGLEQKLNGPGGVNNLDLNEDGKVDFIQVTEYGNDKAKGFSLTVEPVKGETQEIARIEIEKTNQSQAKVNVTGSPQIYGQHNHYSYRHSVGQMLLMAYLFRPHPFYVSPFSFGYYPRYYGGGFARISRTTYVNRTRASVSRSSAVRASSARPSSIRSPNHNKVANRGIKNSLRNPTRSQRAFQVRRRGGQRSGGFGRRSAARQPRGFGAGRSRSRGFGGGRRSRGFGGFRSRGFRSRR